jgi:hypothetical protein
MTKKKIDLSNAPIGTDYKFPKSKFELGPEYEETPWGYSEGSIAQYRGPNNEHVLEYEDYYKGHRDHADPSKDPWGHIVNDAPESLISILAASIIGSIAALFLYRWKEKEDEKNKDKKKTERTLWIWVIIIVAVVIIIFVGLLSLIKFFRDSKRTEVEY